MYIINIKILISSFTSTYNCSSKRNISHTISAPHVYMYRYIHIYSVVDKIAPRTSSVQLNACCEAHAMSEEKINKFAWGSWEWSGSCKKKKKIKKTFCVEERALPTSGKPKTAPLPTYLETMRPHSCLMEKLEPEPSTSRAQTSGLFNPYSWGHSIRYAVAVK